MFKSHGKIVFEPLFIVGWVSCLRFLTTIKILTCLKAYFASTFEIKSFYNKIKTVYKSHGWNKNSTALGPLLQNQNPKSLLHIKAKCKHITTKLKPLYKKVSRVPVTWLK